MQLHRRHVRDARRRKHPRLRCVTRCDEISDQLAQAGGRQKTTLSVSVSRCCLPSEDPAVLRGQSKLARHGSIDRTSPAARDTLESKLLQFRRLFSSQPGVRCDDSSPSTANSVIRMSSTDLTHSFYEVLKRQFSLKFLYDLLIVLLYYTIYHHGNHNESGIESVLFFVNKNKNDNKIVNLSYTRTRIRSKITLSNEND